LKLKIKLTIKRQKLGYNKIKIKMEVTMEKVKQEAKRLWTIAITNKRATAIVIVAVIIIYHLITK